jgi:hypothetical protein
MDATAMFYQWPLPPDSQWFTGVIAHRGQEYFRVCPMGFINSVPHVQPELSDPPLFNW